MKRVKKTFKRHCLANIISLILFWYILSNIGVITKLRHYLSISQRKQIYNTLIYLYPYLSYSIIAWESAYKMQLKKLQSKQNTALRFRMLFFQLRLDLTQKVLSISHKTRYALKPNFCGKPRLRTNIGKQMFSYLE